MESDNKNGTLKGKNKIADESNGTTKKDDQNTLEVIKDQINVSLDDNDANFLAGFDIVDDDDWEDKDKIPREENKKEHDKKLRKSQEKASDASRHLNRSSNNIKSKSATSKRSGDSIKHSRESDKKPDESGTRKNLNNRDVECSKGKDEDKKKTSNHRERTSVTSSSVSSKRKRTSRSPKQGEGAKKVSSQRKESPHSSSRQDKGKEGGSAKKVSPKRKESFHSSSRCDKPVRVLKSDSKSNLSQVRKVDEEHHKKLKELEKKRRSIEGSSDNIKQNRKNSEQSGDKAARRSSNVESVSDRLRESRKSHRDVERHKDTRDSEESKRRHHNVRDTVRRLSKSPKRKRRSRSPVRDRSMVKNLSRNTRKTSSPIIPERERNIGKNLSRHARKTSPQTIPERERSTGKDSSRLKQSRSRKISPLISIRRRPTRSPVPRRRPTRSPVPSLKSRIPYSRRRYSPSPARISPLRKNMSINKKLQRLGRSPAGPQKSLRQESESLLQEIIEKLNDTRSVMLQPVMMVPVPQMDQSHSQQNMLYLPPSMKSASNVTIPASASAISMGPNPVATTTAMNSYQPEQAYQSRNQTFFGSGSTSFHQESPIPNCSGFGSQRLPMVSKQSMARAPGTMGSLESNFSTERSLERSGSGGIPKVAGSANQETLLIRSTKLYGHYLGLSKRSGASDMSDSSSSHPSTPTLSHLRPGKRVPEYSPIPTGNVPAVKDDSWFGRGSTVQRRDASTRNRMMHCSRCGGGGATTRDCSCGMPVSSPAHMSRKLSRN